VAERRAIEARRLRSSAFQFALVAVALLSGAGVLLHSAIASRVAQARVSIVVPSAYPVAPWSADTDNLIAVKGTIKLGGAPVSGLRMRVGTYEISTPTDGRGQFLYLVDHTLLGRHEVTVADATDGKVGGKPLTNAQQSELLAAQASIDIAYELSGLAVSHNAAGEPVITGRLVDSAHAPPPPVGLFTYQLTGTVTDSNGKPVSGAQVSTRTLDRDYWTVSTPTDAHGYYSSLFTASSEASQNPVPFTVRVSIGDVVYQFLSQEFVYFERLQSAKLDIQLPPAGYAMALPRPRSYPGAVYIGTLAGAAVGNTPIRPVAITWPDRSGRFQITLPKRFAGKKVSLFEAKLTLFSPFEAKAGGRVALGDWPTSLPTDSPRDLVSVQLPG
jgi:hypothetical protein